MLAPYASAPGILTQGCPQGLVLSPVSHRLFGGRMDAECGLPATSGSALVTYGPLPPSSSPHSGAWGFSQVPLHLTPRALGNQERVARPGAGVSAAS